MKIAYLFVGHSRTWDKCYQNFFDHIYNFAPGDIYIHTWDTVNTFHGSHWNGWVDLTGEKLDMSLQTPDFTAIHKAYKPKMMIVEKETPVIEMQKKSHACQDKNTANSAVRNILTAFRNLFETVRSQGTYDKYFCTRMDIKYTSDLVIEDLERPYLMSPDIEHNDFCDIWVVGDDHQIDIKTRYVYHIDEYWYNKHDYNNYHHEWALKQYIHDQGIPCKNLGLSYEVVRLF